MHCLRTMKRKAIGRTDVEAAWIRQTEPNPTQPDRTGPNRTTSNIKSNINGTRAFLLWIVCFGVPAESSYVLWGNARASGSGGQEKATSKDMRHTPHHEQYNWHLTNPDLHEYPASLKKPGRHNASTGGKPIDFERQRVPQQPSELFKIGRKSACNNKKRCTTTNPFSPLPPTPSDRRHLATRNIKSTHSSLVKYRLTVSLKLPPRQQW